MFLSFSFSFIVSVILSLIV